MDPVTLLFVDDEPNILNAMKRLFRPHGYKIFTAESGKDGLEILNQQPVNLVVSDMRMPEMNGAQFLEEVRNRRPDTLRILLTGYADLNSTVAAINRGEIYRYISKPWEDNDFVLSVRHALDRKFLEKERERLNELVKSQNEELKVLNASLEDKVEARTEELRQSNDFLALANQQLKDNFLVTIRVFSNLIELRGGAIAGHSRRVADLARRIAQRLSLTAHDIQEIFLAGLLHDIGKIGFPDRLMTKPYAKLTSEERHEVEKHPITGQMALMGIRGLDRVGVYIRSHHERFDGRGFPENLAGDDIPFGSRVLSVANDFDSLVHGMLVKKTVTESEASDFIKRQKGLRYDPEIVDAFIALSDSQEAIALSDSQEAGAVSSGMRSLDADETLIASPQMAAGMMLSRDLLGVDGILLLSREHKLNDSVIRQLRAYEKSTGVPLSIVIQSAI